MTDKITIPHGEKIVDVMQRLQRELLTEGFLYVAGDARTWPMTNVIMMRGGQVVYLVIWRRELQLPIRVRWEQLLKDAPQAELLLVGADIQDSTEISEFFSLVHGTVAYVDAVSRRFRLRPSEWFEAPTLVLREDVLTRMLDPVGDAQVQSINALAALKAHLASQDESDIPRFFTATDANGISDRPMLTITVIAACILVFIGTLLASGMGGLMGIKSEVLLAWGALDKIRVDHGEWWRVITSGFLHASLIHLGMNMMAMYVFATPLEHWLGRWRLGILFLGSVVIGNLLSLWWLPKAFSVGASGGIFGLLGVMLAFLARNWQTIPSTHRAQIGNWLKSVLMYNIIFSLLPGINYAAHAGGFLGGLGLGLLLARVPAGQRPHSSQ